MKYKLSLSEDTKKMWSILSSVKRFFPLLADEKWKLIITLIAVLTNSLSSLASPILIGYTIDHYIQWKDFHGVLVNAWILLAIYIIGSWASYIQTKTMGGVGRRLLFSIRNTIFNKLQELPIDFFNQNKSWDLISRINNDTDKLNQFMSQALMQFVWNFFLISWTGIFILFLDFQLALVALFPAVLVLIITLLLSPWVKRKNLESLQTIGGVSSDIQESLSNFKVILAFNRLDYFRQKFRESNEKNYKTSIWSGIASNIFTPIYGFASHLASLLSLFFGLYLITHWNLTIGLVISFQLYVTNFYTPLRQLASVWASFQLALASLDRVWEVLSLQSDILVLPSTGMVATDSVLEFRNVSFHYPDGDMILHDINFSLEEWKTYALVGPTGGGKTTTASLMARLYDPTGGTIFLHGKDIRTYEPDERTKKIGFILQEPFLFSGTLRENILYGNDTYLEHTSEQLIGVLKQYDLLDFVSRFEWWLDAKIVTSSESMSLGQKQIIAFIRAFLRNPELLILDEATANIDTVTEQLLEEILQKLPQKTTKVVIAHRLNTIKNADEIFFVNSGSITVTGSMENALEMILHWKRES